MWALCCGVWGLWVFKAPLCVDPVLWCVETLRFSTKFPCVWALCCGVLGLGVFIVPLCVCPVLWRVRTLSFRSSHVCELCAVVCEDFNSKILMCVGPVLWRVRTLSFQSSPVRGFCVVFQSSPRCDSVLWFVRSLWFLKVHLYVGTVLWCFQTLSQYWRDWFFQTKVLIGIFTLCWRDCFFLG